MNTRTTERPVAGTARANVVFPNVSGERQAYEILHWGFTALPIVAGVDKFTNALVDWDKYLAPPFDVLGKERTMRAVGAVEIAAGLGVAVKPRVFAPVVMLWLGGIIGNLLMRRKYYDIVLRDFGLCLAALALWRLSTQPNESREQKVLPTR